MNIIYVLPTEYHSIRGKIPVLWDILLIPVISFAVEKKGRFPFRYNTALLITSHRRHGGVVFVGSSKYLLRGPGGMAIFRVPVHFYESFKPVLLPINPSSFDACSFFVAPPRSLQCTSVICPEACRYFNRSHSRRINPLQCLRLIAVVRGRSQNRASNNFPTMKDCFNIFRLPSP